MSDEVGGPPGPPVLCVALNAARDVTYSVDSVVYGEVNRVATTHSQAGGKSINVARLLADWGHRVVVSGFAGGLAGADIVASLDAAGLPHRMVPCAGENRHTVTVVSAAEGTSTGFYEPGPMIEPEEWEAFVAAYSRSLAQCRLVVLAGSLPPGVPPEAYRELAALAGQRGVPVFVDADGKPLLHAVEARPSLVTPNERELADTAGLELPVSVESAVRAAAELLTAGAGRAVVTLGARGLVGVCGEGAWLAVPPAVDGNSAGAGDAVLAVLADAEVRGGAWPLALQRAAATGAAAVRSPIAGSVDRRDVVELLERVEIREL